MIKKAKSPKNYPWQRHKNSKRRWQLDENSNNKKMDFIIVRSKECCTSGLISGSVRGILFVFIGAILELLMGKIPAVV